MGHFPYETVYTQLFQQPCHFIPVPFVVIRSGIDGLADRFIHNGFPLPGLCAIPVMDCPVYLDSSRFAEAKMSHSKHPKGVTLYISKIGTARFVATA